MAARRNRSDRYQHLLVETAYSNDMMEMFSNMDSILHRLNPFEYNEEVLDLEDQLKQEFWRVVDSLLTKRQREVIRLTSSGLTQSEIAKSLNVNQSSITKSLNGNTAYSDNVSSDKKGKKKRYGGTKRRLRKIIESDEKILAILKRMNELREEKW